MSHVAQLRNAVSQMSLTFRDVAHLTTPEPHSLLSEKDNQMPARSLYIHMRNLGSHGSGVRGLVVPIYSHEEWG
jgi:hypothetical protein